MRFSRSSPSARYVELIAMYRQLHEHGVESLAIPSARTFAGASLMRQVTRIKSLIDRTGARTLLDYGSGKGSYYRGQPVAVKGAGSFDSVLDYWNVDSVACYDPAYAPFSDLPKEQFDGVVCTDVMEHCPAEDVPWIVDEMFAYARRFVFVNVACYPAKKTLPNGENAHCTIEPPGWWEAVYRASARRHPGVTWELWATQPDGARAGRMGEVRIAG